MALHKLCRDQAAVGMSLSRSLDSGASAWDWVIGSAKGMKKTRSAEDWAAAWIESVASGSSTMSSRKLTSIEKRMGGLKKVASAAKKQKVHLLLLEDDKGDRIVAASKKPFKVIA